VNTFTKEEEDYVNRLRYRNYFDDFKNQTSPLDNPMGVKEKKLRESIENKCDVYMAELGLAEIAGVLPNRKMREAGHTSVAEVLDKLSWFYIFESCKFTRAVSKNTEEAATPDV
jgi:hypothetical protein